MYFENQGQAVPDFNADSAYAFIQKQVAFGPRNPGSKGHQQTKEYLLNKLRTYAGGRAVYAQEFTAAGYEGDTLALTNIIAAFNLQSTDRILLCAHWDTRPRADEDSVNSNKPILGADDGASGVAVLLELSRLFSKNPPPIGVDIVLFDGEDYGKKGDMSNYFLGSRYWSANPPVKGYAPRFGILLDMVGGENARFPKEQYSLAYAPALVNGIWSVAADEGFEEWFVNKKGRYISDDHLIINRLTDIPVIDIIRHNPTATGAGFAPYWHTHQDNMQIISKETLNGVGSVLAELIYNRIE
ncbi:MAG TPA: M28 family peptidase [Balneolaceae bacterium]|nr:M28 family peptidase [Balneolaceae bacterium]